MDIELRKILDEVYANRMQPDEAQWKICVLFNVSVNEVEVCDYCKGKGYYIEYNQTGNRMINCPKCKQT